MIVLCASVIVAAFYFTFHNPHPSLSLYASPEVVSDFYYEHPLGGAPSVVKAVYLTGWAAGSKKYTDYVLGLAERYGVNAVVIDLKDFSGAVLYDTMAPLVAAYKAKEIHIKDLASVVRRFHSANIYVIGRIVMFQDPFLAHARPDLAIHDAAGNVWRDRKGLAWIDPASQHAWEYLLQIASDTTRYGIDEVNFDYVRFPSDGDLDTVTYPSWDQKIPRHIIIRNFLQFMRVGLRDIKISLDFFGLTTVKTDDLGIGQVFEDAFPYVDALAPMVYPSHYSDGFWGFAKPAAHPYEVVYNSLISARDRLAAVTSTKPLLRPWLQDFELQGIPYDLEKVRAEVRATRDALQEQFAGVMLWNPRNVYTAEALQ